MVNAIYQSGMQVRKLDESLWVVDDVLRMPGGVLMPVRSTLVGLPGGGTAVLSPLPRLGEVRAQVEALGPVRALVAPNLLHHLGLPAAQAAWPEARVFRRPGLDAKRPDVRFTDVLDGRAPELWGGALEHAELPGWKNLEEVAFLHRPSRTLVLTDLCFNVRRSGNLRTRLFMRLNGAEGRFGQTRIGRMLLKDRAAARGSVDRLLAWDFDRVVVAHGEVLERGGKAAVADAFAFLH